MNCETVPRDLNLLHFACLQLNNNNLLHNNDDNIYKLIYNKKYFSQLYR